MLLANAIAYQVVDVRLGNGSTDLVGPQFGGTELIFRLDWEPKYPKNFDARIGESKCHITSSVDKSRYISCLTPPQPDESIEEYPISLFYMSRENIISSTQAAIFTYLTGPEIEDINPREATPGDTVVISGPW